VDGDAVAVFGCCSELRMIRVLVAATIRLYRDGLVRVLSQASSLTVVGAVRGQRETLDVARALTPDVVVLDMASDDSTTTLHELKELRPAVAVVGIGIPELDQEILACAERGMEGYVTREGSVEELVAAIEHAADGELHCTPKFAGLLMRRLAAVTAAHEPARMVERLTSREYEIVTLLGQDLSNKEIASRLGIEVATVKNHVHNLFEKLQVHRSVRRQPEWHSSERFQRDSSERMAA
jgi:DNA-binding NarL/FixJ family response regulator